jgi:gliding motility-associated lipoprotein GldD
MKKWSGLIVLLLLACISCGEDPQPKPKAYLALEYPEAEYEVLDQNCPYKFEKNKWAKAEASRSQNDCWIDLNYEMLNGTIFITYQTINNNLDSLLTDAQKLPLRHTIKADAIEGDIYTNPYHKTYGMFYEVTGDAASQAQFYLTDSVQHFLTGSVYFNARPNFDSILPAAAYLKKDIRHLMETVKWQNPE